MSDAVSPIRRAAQYIRMSTDRQDLSPQLQKDAIASFAAAHAIEVVATYEDGGKSGVRLENRPRLRQLLADVSGRVPFSEILVYDVSRWGRFQDVDAAAYHEYHCRMHGVQVLYVSESFDNDHKPTTVLLKSMKRVMAAEYSRELASKSRAGQERVVSMGFHMGALPPLGYRRCSVSADGARQIILSHGQLKVALTDRIKWVLGPAVEVELVRRIFAAYADGLALEDLAGLVRAEGWRTVKGREVTTRCIKILLQHEAPVGNFVWGSKSKGGKIVTCSPNRMDGSVPRIVDDQTWSRVQERLKHLRQDERGKQSDRTPSRAGARRQQQLQLAFEPGPADQSYRRRLGTGQQLRDHTREFGKALVLAFQPAGLFAAFDTRSNLLTFWGGRVRLRLMWPVTDRTWVLERNRGVQAVSFVLVARMAAMYRAIDFFVLPAHVERALYARPFPVGVPRDLLQHWCDGSESLIRRLSALTTTAVGRRRRCATTRRGA